MRFTGFLLAAAAHGALAAPQGPSEPVFSCGTPKPSAEHRKMMEKFATDEAAFAASGNITARQVITVDTYFHVVASRNSVLSGLLSQATVLAQLAILNLDFLPRAIQFNNKGIDFTINPTWASGGDEIGMKTALRKGTYQTLNIYFIRKVTPGSEAYIVDGCTINSNTVPGGDQVGYNLGHTTTHEVGHWFGLYHTFENGCNFGGDLVDDTPYEAGKSTGCQIGRDSCPSRPGTDPVTNYMDYSLDTCVTGFTPGQGVRMISNWNTYRAGK